LSLLAWEVMDSQANEEPKIDASLITEYLPNLSYFLTDFYEKLYDDAMTALTSSIDQTSVTASLLSTTSPTIINPVGGPAISNLATPPKPLVQLVQQSVKTSPPIVLKISTKKLEIISTIKIQIVENELCSVLLIYLIIACLEVNDWTNLKVLLPSIRYPNNNYNQFEKWFMFQFFNYLTEKNIIEQFKHDWFVNLIFDEFLFYTMKQKDEQLQLILQQDKMPQQKLLDGTFSANIVYEQVYKLIDRVYPAYLNGLNFNRIVDHIKPKKFVRFLKINIFHYVFNAPGITHFYCFCFV
jgi:hypothetical protein